MNRRRTLKPGAGPSPDELDVHDLKEAQSILHGFTRAGFEQQPTRGVDFNDRIAVATLELRGKITADPRSSGFVGAWLSRMKDRGAGHCTPLNGRAEGLYMLMLDAQAMAELWDAMAAHRADVADYVDLQANLAQLRKLKDDDVQGASGGEAQS